MPLCVVCLLVFPLVLFACASISLCFVNVVVHSCVCLCVCSCLFACALVYFSVLLYVFVCLLSCASGDKVGLSRYE